MTDREMIAVFHYDDGGSNRLGAEPYRYAEEIIRCKECRHWWNKYGDTACMLHSDFTTDADDFCSHGERSEE